MIMKQEKYKVAHSFVNIVFFFTAQIYVPI